MILPVATFLLAQTEAAKLAIDKNISFEEASDILFREKEDSAKQEIMKQDKLLNDIYNKYKQGQLN